MFRILSILELVLFGTLAVAVEKKGLRSTHNAAASSSFVRSLEFKHRLRVCNAYPYGAALDLYRGRSEKMTDDGPLSYKSCKDFKSPLKAGDKLEFKVGDANA